MPGRPAPPGDKENETVQHMREISRPEYLTSLHVQIAEISDRLAQVGLEDLLTARQPRRRVPLESAGVLAALVAHPEGQTTVEAANRHEESFCAKLAVRYPAARHPDRRPCADGWERFEFMLEVADLQSDLRDMRPVFMIGASY